VDGFLGGVLEGGDFDLEEPIFLIKNENKKIK